MHSPRTSHINEFGKDKKTLYAVIRCFEVLGEAVKHIPDHVRQTHPEIPWKGLAGMRDKIIHGYFGIDVRIVWDTIEEDLPSLREAVGDIIYKENIPRTGPAASERGGSKGCD